MHVCVRCFFVFFCFGGLLLSSLRGETYPRAAWKNAVIDRNKLSLPEQERTQLLKWLNLAVREAPQGKMSLEWKSRLLGLALALDPADRDAVVADGQLSRGILPGPLAWDGVKPAFSELGMKMLPVATKCLRGEGLTADDQALGAYLLDAVIFLDPSNQRLWESFFPNTEKSGIVHWSALQRKESLPKQWVEKELNPIMGATEVVASLLLKPQDPPYAFTAVAEVSGNDLKPMEIGVEGELREALKSKLPAIKQLLVPWHDEFPKGWTIRFANPKGLDAKHPGWALATALCIEGLISGKEINPQATLACGLDVESGKIVDWLGPELVVARLRREPVADAFFIVGPNHENVLQDWLILDPTLAAVFWRRPVCLARQLADVVGLTAKPLPEKLQAAQDEFTATARSLDRDGLPSLKSPPGIEKLANVVQIHQNNLSASLLYKLASGTLPTNLSTEGSFFHIQRVAQSIRKLLNKFNLTKARKPAAGIPVYSQAASYLNKIRPKIAQAAWPLLDAWVGVAKWRERYDRDPVDSPRGFGKAEQEFKALQNQMLQLKAITEDDLVESPTPPTP